MTHMQSWKRYSTGLVLGLFVCGSFAGPTCFAQSGTYRSIDSSPAYTSGAPNLSEATAVLDAAVRNLYKKIEPGSEPNPNELIAYADLRVLRLYTGALEVAGWDLETSTREFSQRDYMQYRYNQNIGDARLSQRRERYLAFRETVRSLLYRVRTTAVSVEHQVSFCDPRVSDEWRREVVPALLDTIAATQPLFYDDDDASRYHLPGQQVSNIIPTSTGIPSNAVEVSKPGRYLPYDGKGQGTGRYFEVKAFGGPIRVRKIRFRELVNSFGTISSSVPRELIVDKVIEKGETKFFACYRERLVDLTGIEVEWEPVDPRIRAYGSIDLVEDIPGRR